MSIIAALLLCWLPEPEALEPTSFFPKWEEYKSAPGRFAVQVPGELTEKINTSETAIGTLELHSFVYEEKDPKKEFDNWVYIVSYCDYPAGSIHSDSTALLADFFEVTTEEAVGNVQGKLTYSAPFSLGVFPGKTWRIDYNKGKAVLKTRIIMANNRLYTLQAACEKSKSMNASFEKFFDSFRIL